MEKVHIGLVGLGVMGQNLILNMESKGYSIAAYNRTSSKTKDFAQSQAKGKKIKPAYT
ncbi:MAG: NAD(P)-binding domain-containing protein, partial [Atribacterota bacterium]|nr:NAD(P)-binding domain-containing protein [Atribacterota bacterium]